MDLLEVGVLLVAAAASLWLIYYVRQYLPARLDERFRESLKAFSTAVELRFPNYAGVSQRVLSLSNEVGAQMGLKPSKLRDLNMAATLRDIGLCAIPYSLVNGKSSSDWTPAERMTFDRHPEVSGAMLELVPSLSHLADAVRWHHANFRGDTAQDVPTGSKLPIEARVMKVVSEYVRLERTQGELLAREAIREGLGAAYCPKCGEALLAVLTFARVGDAQATVAV